MILSPQIIHHFQRGLVRTGRVQGKAPHLVWLPDRFWINVNEQHHRFNRGLMHASHVKGVALKGILLFHAAFAGELFHQQQVAFVCCALHPVGGCAAVLEGAVQRGRLAGCALEGPKVESGRPHDGDDCGGCCLLLLLLLLLLIPRRSEARSGVQDDNSNNEEGGSVLGWATVQ